ncbi:hypothetical protein VR46_08250 [Streptomyces sp. NRRL S-444]|nr:hypothetical protein VR46_08250 [Streptomyces sp. NRRL S-444]
MRRAVRRIVAMLLAAGALATLLAAVGWLTAGRFVDLLALISVIAPAVCCAVAAGPAVIAPAPWLRRTMHPSTEANEVVPA